MKIAIIGTSRITEDHIKVLTKLRNKIVSISSTRKNSKNLKLLAQKFKIKKLLIIGKNLLSTQVK